MKSGLGAKELTSPSLCWNAAWAARSFESAFSASNQRRGLRSAFSQWERWEALSNLNEECIFRRHFRVSCGLPQQLRGEEDAAANIERERKKAAAERRGRSKLNCAFLREGIISMETQVIDPTKYLNFNRTNWTVRRRRDVRETLERRCHSLYSS